MADQIHVLCVCVCQERLRLDAGSFDGPLDAPSDGEEIDDPGPGQSPDSPREHGPRLPIFAEIRPRFCYVEPLGRMWAKFGRKCTA